MKLTLVRHGRPDEGHRERPHDPPLREDGRRQAEAVATLLAQEGVTAIVASPMQRAQDTARPLAARLGLSVRTVEGWAEADRHVEHYRSTETLRALGDAEWQRFLDDPVRYLGGDPQRFREAVLDALRATTKGDDDAHVAVFTHGLPINIALSFVLGLQKIVHFRPGYGSVTRLIARSGRFGVVSVNESAHFRLPMTPPIDDAALAPRIQHYLSEQAGHAVRVGAVRRFPVGFSWLTYAVPVDGLDEAGPRELILRLGPDYGLFAPYSALPQVLSMRSLVGSGVPVPRAFWHGDDPTILGAPFMFCDKAEGEAVVPWVSPSEPPLDEGLRIRLAHQFIDCLAALHRVDWRRQPIAAMAGDVDEHNAALRSVQTWEALVRRWQMRPYPLADWGLRWLKTHCPQAPRVTIVHGDYRTGNFLQSDGTITAVLDWELVHLGDPHEDLAWASMPMYKGGTPYIGRLAEPELFYGRYAQQSGIEVSMATVRYYQVFSLLKLAATHMAAARCFEEGRFNDMRMPAMGSQIATCLRQMDKLIESA